MKEQLSQINQSVESNAKQAMEGVNQKMIEEMKEKFEANSKQLTKLSHENQRLINEIKSNQKFSELAEEEFYDTNSY